MRDTIQNMHAVAQQSFPRTNLRVSLIRSVQKLSESHAKLFLQFSILDWDDITESMAPLLPGGVASVQSASTPPDEIRKIEMPPKLFETKIVRAAFELGATEIRRLVWPDDRVEFMFRPFWKTNPLKMGLKLRDNRVDGDGLRANSTFNFWPQSWPTADELAKVGATCGEYVYEFCSSKYATPSTAHSAV